MDPSKHLEHIAAGLFIALFLSALLDLITEPPSGKILSLSVYMFIQYVNIIYKYLLGQSNRMSLSRKETFLHKYI